MVGESLRRKILPILLLTAVPSFNLAAPVADQEGGASGAGGAGGVGGSDVAGETGETASSSQQYCSCRHFSFFSIFD